MTALTDYIQRHTTTVAGDTAPVGQKAVQLIFMDVIPSENADAGTLRELIGEHQGAFGDVNPFDGSEHSYIELGGWLGSQQYALALIGLGTHLGLWSLLSPRTMLPGVLTHEQEQALAGQGLISIQAAQ